MVQKVAKYSTIVVAALVLGAALSILATYPEFKRAMRAANDRITAHSKILRTDKYAIEYSVKGKGIPVLLLHGAGGGYDQGLWIGKTSLGEGYKFISVSRFAYLNSSVPTGASIKSQAVAYAALLDHLGINRVIVLGGSAGGPSAMQFANDYPGRTRGLILMMAVSMADHSLDNLPVQVRIIHLTQQSDYIYWIFAEYFPSTMLGLMGTPPDKYKHFTAEQKELAQVMLDDMHPMSRRYAGTFNDNVMIQEFSLAGNKISAPTLILHAKDDSLVGYHHAENSHKHIRQSRLVLFEDGGHAMLPRLYEIRRLAREFISKNS